MAKMTVLYQVIVEGCLDDRWLRWFEGMEIHQDDEDNTVITGEMDQSCLFGVLNRIRDLGIELVSVQRMYSQPDDKY